nr:pentapeptide repeat-containing protein [Amycolatopsis sp. WAC 04182]
MRFLQARLVGVRLDNAHLQGALLREADLDSASLVGADLAGAELNRARLDKADLTGATLAKAGLRAAKMHSAILAGADLTGADLENADLENADFTGATLTDARFGGARLQDAKGLHNGFVPSEPGVDATTSPLSRSSVRGVRSTSARGHTHDGRFTILACCLRTDAVCGRRPCRCRSTRRGAVHRPGPTVNVPQSGRVASAMRSPSPRTASVARCAQRSQGDLG